MRKLSSSRWALIACLACPLWAGDAMAQAPTRIEGLPTPAQPQPPRERLDAPRGQPDAPTATPTGPSRATEAPAGASEIDVVLRSVVIEGSTIYAEQKLAEYYRDHIGKEISLATVFEIAARIEALYRDDGYVLTRVVVPEQVVEDGDFRITVIEGYISEIVLQGDAGPVQDRIEDYLGKIAGKRPVRLQDIERYLLLVNDLPGVAARGTIRPAGGEAGASQLVVDVAVSHYGAFATVSNRGSRFTGPWSAAVGASASAFTPFGERVEVILFRSLPEQEQQFGQVTFESRVGSEGGRLRLTYGRGPSNPGFTVKELDIESVTTSGGIHFAAPFIRSRTLNLQMDMGIDLENTHSDNLGQRSTEDRLRVFRLSGSLDFRDQIGGLTALTLGFGKGLNFFNTTKRSQRFPQSREEGESLFWKTTAEVSRVQNLWRDDQSSINLLAVVSGQYTRAPLPASEEFRLGGERFGRGYVPSELSGDKAVGTTLELQYNATTSWSVLQRYQLYAFHDFGTVWNYDLTNRGRESLASAGFGTRLEITDWMSVDLEAARQLTRFSSARSDLEKVTVLYGRLTVRY